MAKLNPDLLAFVGDQFYESSGGYGVLRGPLEPAILDYLRKWYLHGWTWRELTRDRPSISIPDDHDVHQFRVGPHRVLHAKAAYHLRPAQRRGTGGMLARFEPTDE